jgi:hypothetical protein
LPGMHRTRSNRGASSSLSMTNKCPASSCFAAQPIVVAAQRSSGDSAPPFRQATNWLIDAKNEHRRDAI